MTALNPTPIIERYLQAYEAANRIPLPRLWQVTYEKGWFVFSRQDAPETKSRYRRAEFEQTIGRLEAVAAERVP